VEEEQEEGEVWTAAWRPLETFAVVEQLPRGALLEVQPLGWVGGCAVPAGARRRRQGGGGSDGDGRPESSSGSSSSSDDEAGDGGGGDWRLCGGARGGWAAQEEAAVRVAFVCVPGRLLRAHCAVAHAAAAAAAAEEPWAAAADRLVRAVERLGAEARVELREHAASVRAYLTPAAARLLEPLRAAFARHDVGVLPGASSLARLEP
jgi:hypothetical protein